MLNRAISKVNNTSDIEVYADASSLLSDYEDESINIDGIEPFETYQLIQER